MIELRPNGHLRVSWQRARLVSLGLGALLYTACVGCGFEPCDEDEDTYCEEEGDCNDGNDFIHPGQEDIPYNGVDEDCSGSDSVDLDGDGQPSIKVKGGKDCNDGDADIFAGNAEVCDGKDNDCDSNTAIDDQDGDGDGCTTFNKGKDCNDSEPSIYFGAWDVPYDGIDQDCVGGDVTDYDGDGNPGIPAGGTDCDDYIGLIKPTGFDPNLEVYIAGGPFTMGSSTDDPDAEPEEQPQHDVTLSPYCIDKYEVTNKQFRLCVDQGICTPPTETSASGRDEYFGEPQWNEYPVIGVTYDQALAYCGWRYQSLPSEAQWEKAARGGHCLSGGTAENCPAEFLNPNPTRLYPWGDEEPTCELANFTGKDENGTFFCGEQGTVRDTDPVAARSTAASPYGMFNMAGNVSEWVWDYYLDSYYSSSPETDPYGAIEGTNRSIRSGSFGDRYEYLRAAARDAYSPSRSENYLGFRCARWDFTPIPPAE